VVLTGAPIREELFEGDRDQGLAWLNLDGHKPVLLIMGGGQGSNRINRTVRESLDNLLEMYDVVHLCGKGKVASDYIHRAGYRQFDYLHSELFDVLACADIVISRAGANATCELLALKKLNLLIPLAQGSRGDQISNAHYTEKLGLSKVLDEAKFSPQSLVAALEEINLSRVQYQEALAAFHYSNGTDHVVAVITGVNRGGV
jgi:UDP-N-acetylglucosamine--N-acetylmuramyl-(pentapeptide) pyrophosphoryl-undecaprenol N-acetylglucosamine transferase